MSFDLPLDRMDWQAFRNDSGEVVPAFGIMEVTGAIIRDDDVVLTITKPSTTFGRPYAVNGDSEVAIGGYGNCTNSSPCPQYYTSGTTPAFGNGYGPKPGIWTLEKGYPATTIVDVIVDSTNKILYGSFQPITTVIGKAGSDIAALSSETPGYGTVTAWYNNAGTFAETTFTFTGYNFSTSVITASKYTVYNLVNGIWVAVFEGC